MNPAHTLKTGSKPAVSLAGRVPRIKTPGHRTAGGPTKIFYLWEKHGIKRIELFSME